MRNGLVTGMMVSAMAMLATAATAQSDTAPLQIDLRAPAPALRDSHLKAGGKNAAGESIAVNNYYMSVDGKPVIALTGEIHFYRYPRQYWEEELLKMKAGGIDTVATYVHWIVHEEREGVFDWTGDRDMRAFIELCKKLNMKVILRLGPFGHGEVRSGGFPDWLLGRPLTVRSNDPVYLSYVSRLYKQVSQQVKGLLFKDGGPIIGLQIENEYQHSASPWALNYPGQPLDFTVAPSDSAITRQGVGTAMGTNSRAEIGVEHMRKLKALALEAGLDAPLWTATGWGNATIIPNETVPVQAAYAYPSWEPKGVPSTLYTYKNLQQDPDYAPLSYDAKDYPYLAAELGPGMINNYTRRPVIPPESADALVNRFLGSGSNGIGYYMYQSGTTPRGKYSFLADEAFAYPHLSYDFGGPLGEFGEVRPTFHRLKVLQYFMDTFGDRLAPAPVVLPAGAKSISPTDVDQVRYAARGANGTGFLFINNFQDHVINKAKDARFAINTPQGAVSLPLVGSLHIPAGENMILPVNFDLDGVRLVSATVQPLTRVADTTGGHYVFFSKDGVARQFVFGKDVDVRASAKDGCTVKPVQGQQLVECADADVAKFRVQSGAKGATVVLLDEKAALSSWLVGDQGSRRLLLSNATPLSSQGQVSFRALGENAVGVRIYPSLPAKPQVVGTGSVKMQPERRGFSSLTLTQPRYTPKVKFSWPASNKLTVDLPPASLPAGVSDVWLNLPYEADTAMAFVGGELVADHFYAGEPWRIGTKRFLGKDDSMLFYFRPLHEKMAFFADLPKPPILAKGEQRIRADAVTMTPEYETTIRF